MTQHDTEEANQLIQRVNDLVNSGMSVREALAMVREQKETELEMDNDK